MFSRFISSASNRISKTYQVRIRPVTFEGSRHLGNDEVVHLLGSFWVVSEVGQKINALV